MALLDMPSRFAVAEDYPPPPRTRNPSQWVRDETGRIWLRKELRHEHELLAESVAVVMADRLDVRVADGAPDLRAKAWFSLRLDLSTWNRLYGDRIEMGTLSRLILFDLVLGITDRHEENVLLEPVGSHRIRPIGIDHELAVAAYQGRNDIPLRHQLPGCRFDDPELVSSLRQGAAEVDSGSLRTLCDLGPLRPVFPDADLPGVETALRVRCSGLRMLVETWIGRHGGIST